MYVPLYRVYCAVIVPYTGYEGIEQGESAREFVLCFNIRTGSYAFVVQKTELCSIQSQDQAYLHLWLLVFRHS